MKDERLCAVAILNIERDTTNFIEANHMEDIIDEFATMLVLSCFFMIMNDFPLHIYSFHLMPFFE